MHTFWVVKHTCAMPEVCEYMLCVCVCVCVVLCIMYVKVYARIRFDDIDAELGVKQMP